MPDHVHLFIGLKPNQCISDLVRDIKTASSAFIKEKRWIRSWFEWQEGFGAFFYAHLQIDDVIKYILKQEEHHHIKSFKEEYRIFLSKFNIDYIPKYLFEFYE